MNCPIWRVLRQLRNAFTLTSMSPLRVTLAFVTLLGMSIAACSGGNAETPTSPSSMSAIGSGDTAATGSGVTIYTYTTDLKPILATDCTRCHNATQHEGGYDFTTFAGVRRAVAVGSARSPLVRETQPSGGMYRELSGNRTQKASVIYDWVVSSGAAE